MFRLLKAFEYLTFHSYFSGTIGTFGLADGSEEWLLPLLAKEFIEDHDVEWRTIDYSLDMGPPPTSFLMFMCQYDCHVFPKRMTDR